MHFVPEAACWSESTLPLSSLMTSPTLFSSVGILSPLLCCAPGTSAGARLDPRPPLACGVHRWGAGTAAFAWAASVASQATSETRGRGSVLVIMRLPACSLPDTPVKQTATCQLHQTGVYTLLPAATPSLAAPHPPRLGHVPREPGCWRQE